MPRTPPSEIAVCWWILYIPNDNMAVPATIQITFFGVNSLFISFIKLDKFFFNDISIPRFSCRTKSVRFRTKTYCSHCITFLFDVLYAPVSFNWYNLTEWYPFYLFKIRCGIYYMLCSPTTFGIFFLAIMIIASPST